MHDTGAPTFKSCEESNIVKLATDHGIANRRTFTYSIYHMCPD